MKTLFFILAGLFLSTVVFAQLAATIGSSTNASCYSLCNGSATVNATGGVMPYSYEWSSGALTATATNLCAGTYTVTVTDNTLATATASVNIAQPAPLNAVLISQTNDFCFGGCTGTASVSASGGTAPYQYSWSNGVSIALVQNLCAGIYTLTVVDANACTTTLTITITQPPPLIVTTTVTNEICNQTNGAATATPSGGVPGYTYLWSNGNTTNTLNNVPGGNYIISVTDATGCFATASAAIQNIAPVFDLGNNFSLCTATCDTLVINADHGAAPYTYLWEDATGNDSLVYCPTGSGYVYATVTDNAGCPAIDSVYVQVLNNCNTISGYVYNDINNDGIFDTGEEGISDKMVTLMPGPFYTNTDALGFYSFLADTGTYTLETAGGQFCTVSPAQHTAIFTGTGQTDAANDFGIYIVPINDLRIDLNSSNMRPGFETMYYIYYDNDGTLPRDITITLEADTNLVYISCDSVPASIIDHTFTWQFNGIQPGQHGIFVSDFTVPSTVPIGDTIISTVSIDPILNDTCPQNNVMTYARIVTGSYDPNDKAVDPAGIVTPDEVADGIFLTYLVRFQNSGTDTAFNIHIIDTLSSNLDIPTFEILSSSHPCTWTIHGQGVIDFKFDNILLPDSNVNEPGSQGFVKYRIKPLSTLSVGDDVSNTAYIYFDFNVPVATNTVVSAIDFPSDVPVLSSENSNLQLYPNPSAGTVTASFELTRQESVTVKIFDMYGRCCKTISGGILNEGRHLLNFDLDKNGLYNIRISIGSETLSSKLIIAR